MKQEGQKISDGKLGSKEAGWASLERGYREAQVENVIKFMKENFDDDYGQDRVEHVIEKLSEFKELQNLFTERQIARLALLDVADPSYKYEDKNRPNTHFEDALQMAKFVYENYDRLEELGLNVPKEILAYAFLNHDIGKAGEGSSTAIAKFFNLKDEQKLADRKNIPVDQPPRIGQVMRLLDLDKDQKNWQAIQDYIGVREGGAENMEQLPALRVYNKHEAKLSELKAAFSENIVLKNDEEGQKFLLNLVQSHHNDRNPQILLDLKKIGHLAVGVFMDILDKSQAFLLRTPRRTLQQTFNIMTIQANQVIPEAKELYLKILTKLYGAQGSEVGETNFLKRELERYEKER